MVHYGPLCSSISQVDSKYNGTIKRLSPQWSARSSVWGVARIVMYSSGLGAKLCGAFDKDLQWKNLCLYTYFYAPVHSHDSNCCLFDPGRLFKLLAFLFVISQIDWIRWFQIWFSTWFQVAKLFQIDSDINHYSRIPYPLVLAECLQEPQCLVESHDCDASQGQQKRRQRKSEQEIFMFKASNIPCRSLEHLIWRKRDKSI